MDPLSMPMPSPPTGPAREFGLAIPMPAAHPWDGYLAGPENELAWAGASALARGEAGAVSPLVVVGAAGVGKSRLLAGLVAERIARKPGASVAHLGADAFAQLCSEAGAVSGGGGWADLRDRLRRLDLLVLEDLHGLERVPPALAELAYTLDALEEAGASVAVSARTGPAEWSGPGSIWPPRLVNRLVGGLIVRIEPPGPASRRRYLLDRARGFGLTVPAESAEAMTAAADGYRTLDGWLARLALDARLGHRPDAGSVERLSAEGGGPDGSPAIEAVAKAVAARFKVRVRDLRAATRRKAVAEPRHLAMLLAREATGLSFVAIGTYFGRRDSATVRHACRVASDRIAADPALAAAAESLRRGWKPAPPPIDAG